jgi:hypothetical protein
MSVPLNLATTGTNLMKNIVISAVLALVGFIAVPSVAMTVDVSGDVIGGQDGIWTYGDGVEGIDFDFAGTSNSNGEALAAFQPVLTDAGAVEIWKSDEPTSDFSFVMNGDASGGTLTDAGGQACAGLYCFLLVKDGNHDPFAYLVSIEWDGSVPLSLVGFWPGGGSISHISIFTGDELPQDFPRYIPEVPLPASAWLFLSALGGLTALRKRQASR